MRLLGNDASLIGNNLFKKRLAMIKLLLNTASLLLLCIRPLRLAFNYVSERCEGFQYGSYSLEDEAALALSFVNNNSGCIIDAGANIGSYTRALIESGMELKLIMIEPAPALHHQLMELASTRGSVSLEPVALGADAGSLELYFDNDGSSLASLYQREISHLGVVMKKSVRVPVVKLDSIADKYELYTIDCLKLDLEGHELEALKGANKLLDEKRIRAIVFEFGGCNIDSRTYVKDFWSILVEKHGFTFYRLAPKRHLIKLESYSEALERFTWQNILACAPSVEPTWKVIR